ncbi:MAG: DNA repair protein RecN [Gammaproteobacteria bacterium]|nr:DNA repair protein RecN [Gammaproteobacteria bacterium]
MLNHIQIRNFAIVDELSIDFSDGMSALTGETGAGKSILLNAINLCLGDRADSNNIRHGEDRAEISASFNIDPESPAYHWLHEQEIDQGEECLIRRVINREGRSKGFINGSPMPMQSLKELGEMLVDIHGQHEHQSLLKRDIQRQLIDDYAGNDNLLDSLKKNHRLWRQKNSQLDTLKQSANERQSRLELLHYQVEELNKLELQPSEFSALSEEQSKLANAEKLQTTTQQCLHQLYENEQNNIHQSLSQTTRSLEELIAADPKLKNITDMLNNATIQIQESSSDLRDYVENIELDPKQLSQVDERLGLIMELSRKHQVKPNELTALHSQLTEELSNINTADKNLGLLQNELNELEKQYHNIANQLSAQRTKAAKQLNKKVTSTIRELGMPSIEFSIRFDKADTPEINANGYEKIEFMISPNPGQPEQPLRKIASGGELSRISLAIQTALADATHIPTLIYDEVDAGIGGPTAEVVGKKLRALGNKGQVFCITHLAQVASQAHHHLHVSKQISKNNTSSSILQLDEQQRINETARMLGGIEITDQSLSHAREMISLAQTEKRSKRKQA